MSSFTHVKDQFLSRSDQTYLRFNKNYLNYNDDEINSPFSEIKIEQPSEQSLSKSLSSVHEDCNEETSIYLE